MQLTPPSRSVASHHVVRVLVPSMHHCSEQVTADAARHRVRQLRSDGELGLRLFMRVVTLARADCGVLRERCRGRDHVFAVVEDGGGGSAAGVGAVRLVQRADVRGQRVWRRHVGVLDAIPCCVLHWLHSWPFACSSLFVVCPGQILVRRVLRAVRDRVPVHERGEAAGAAPHGRFLDAQGRRRV